MGLLRVRLEVTCSWRSWRAACCCSTPMSSWARLLSCVSRLPCHGLQGGAYSVFSGLECGGGAMLGSCGRWIRSAWSRGAYGASGRRSVGRDLLVGQVFHDGNVHSLRNSLRKRGVTKRSPRSCDRTAQHNWKQQHTDRLHDALHAGLSRTQSRFSLPRLQRSVLPQVQCDAHSNWLYSALSSAVRSSQIGTIPHAATKRCPSHSIPFQPLLAWLTHLRLSTTLSPSPTSPAVAALLSR
jgi:hypothetical protein